MVGDKPDWSQASYQEMNDLVIRQGGRIAELELRLKRQEQAIQDWTSEKERYVAELEKENQELRFKVLHNEWGKKGN